MHQEMRDAIHKLDDIHHLLIEKRKLLAQKATAKEIENNLKC
jgi:hypothetical protein